MDKELQTPLQNIKAFVSSASGVLQNNRDILLVVKEEICQGIERSHYDGQGVSLLRSIGINIAFVVEDQVLRLSPIRAMINRWNSLPSTTKIKGDNGWPIVELIHHDHCVGEAQIPLVERWLTSLGLTFADCAVMGHDLVQIPLMKKGAFRVVPAQAESVAKLIADWITPRRGGDGALRDFANLVLEAKGIDPTMQPTR